MSMETQLIDRIKDRIRSGLVFMGGAHVNKFFTERFARKFFGEFGELATGGAMSIGLEYLGIRARLGEFEPYVAAASDAAADFGFYESIYRAKIVKEPKCWAPDANSVKCINFDVDVVDATNVTVYVDDVAQTVSGVTGGPSEFEIALSAPLATGWRKLVVNAGTNKKDAFSGKVYVP